MQGNLLKRTVTSVFLIIILLFGLFYNDLSWKLLVMFFLFLCFYEFYNLINRIYKNKFFSTILLFLSGLYLYFFYLLLIRIRFEFGEVTVLILFVCCFFSDIGGYVVGKLIGGPKLTTLSPNKTISGSFGSVIFTIVGTFFFVMLLDKIEKNPIQIEISYKIFIWLFLMSIFCQIGDLFISYFKRKAKIKDTGNLLPGHGGLLDRLDGVLLGIPLGILLYTLLL